MSARHRPPHDRPSPRTSAQHRPGRHELGQNFLRDRRVIRAIVELAARDDHALVEWAAGDGALTLELASLGRPMEAVEIDARYVARLRRRVPPHVAVIEEDILRHAPPHGTWTLVCNVPFHITTAVMQHLLRLPGWDRAILLTQWEVARKRAGVGGATQLTAQWWPWFEFTLQQRVPAAAFSPPPSVDGGLLLIERRHPLLVADRTAYQQWVREVFTGRGRGLPQIVGRACGVSPRQVHDWCLREGLSPLSLPRDLTARQWVSAFRLSEGGTGRRRSDRV